jgi:hypothetical protein
VWLRQAVSTVQATGMPIPLPRLTTLIDKTTTRVAESGCIERVDDRFLVPEPGDPGEQSRRASGGEHLRAGGSLGEHLGLYLGAGFTVGSGH